MLSKPPSRAVLLAVSLTLALLGLNRAGGAAAAAALDPELQARLGSATFEVVMRKPEHDSATYEKPLPMDLMPYMERTDKYRSIGTAFAIAPNTYVSAAHVFDSGVVSQYGEPQLRDAGGTVRELDKIVKYSNEQDFIVFTLKQPFDVKPLQVNRQPAMNEAVFTAGNALGEGNVVRDGLLTSQTPEEVNARWKWLRFSAAASPGNSGGPLLDKQGRVIGVVLRKSPNENLNYAAPIALVLDAPDNLARVGGYAGYQLPVLDTKESERPKFEFPLPKPWSAFRDELKRYWNGLYDRLQAQLLSKHADEIFPQGAGSKRLLNGPGASATLAMIVRKSDGTWESNGGTNSANATLPHNGSVTLGVMTGALGAIIVRPDDVPPATFYKDSRTYMDYLLKAFPLQRPIGNERVRITSLGPAQSDTNYADAYGRTWQVRSWNIEFWDIVIVSYALAVPEGYVALVRVGPTYGVHDATLDLRAMTSFVDVAFGGTLEQWRGYLTQKALLPANFANIDIAFDYGRNFRYKSRRFDLAFDDSLQRVAKDSLLTLRFGYLQDAGKVVWDVVGVQLVEKRAGGQTLDVSRHTKPDASLPDAFHAEWNKMLTRAYPYDGSVIDSGGDVSVNAIYPLANVPAADAATTNVLYEVDYGNQGKHPPEEVKGALAKWFQGLRVQEK